MLSNAFGNGQVMHAFSPLSYYTRPRDNRFSTCSSFELVAEQVSVALWPRLCCLSMLTVV